MQSELPFNPFGLIPAELPPVNEKLLIFEDMLEKVAPTEANRDHWVPIFPLARSCFRDFLSSRGFPWSAQISDRYS